MKPRFLVLGVGNAQVDLLQRLQGHCEVHALSNARAGRGLPFVDHFEEIDITNRDAVLDYARRHAIDHIYSVGSDVAMPTVAYVAESLGLKTLVSSGVAEICNHKVSMRTALRDAYGALPFELLDATHRTTSLSFPVVVKPVDSQGQRGVSMVETPDGLDAALQRALPHSRSGQAIVEPLVDGREISVNVYLLDGEVVFFLPSDRISWSGLDGGIIHKHLLPASMTAAEQDRVKRLVLETVGALGLRQGPAYFQIKVADGHPYLIEVTPRLDGCHMWRLIQHATGVDLLDMAIRHMFSEPVASPVWSGVRPAMLEFFCQAPDTPFTQAQAHPGAVHLEWYYEPGATVRRMNGKMEKCGYQIVMADAS